MHMQIPHQHSYIPTPTYQYLVHKTHTNTPTIPLQNAIPSYGDPSSTLLQSYDHTSILNTYTLQQHSYKPA